MHVIPRRCKLLLKPYFLFGKKRQNKIAPITGVRLALKKKKKKKVNTKRSANVYVVVRVHHFYFFEKSKRTNKCLFIYPDTEFKMTV